MISIALIAHDSKKDDLVAFVTRHHDQFKGARILATGTTGQRIADASGFSVERMLSGPLGGDVQVASRVAEGKIDLVIFLVDPLDAHPHEPDIQGLLRVCNVHDIPLATNLASAILLLNGLTAGMQSQMVNG